MRVAAAQIDVKLGEVEANLAAAVDWIGRAAEAGADLVVLPECALTGYCFESREEALPHARAIDDPLWQRISKACGAGGNRFAVIGFLERDGECLYNASALVGPAGVLGSYRKIHLPHLGVDRFVDCSQRPYAVYQAGEMRVGLAICYDSSFPEPMRVLGLEQADVIALSTNWPVAARRTAEIVPPARSMENHLYFIAANRIGRERSFHFCGLSSICGPDGVELARAVSDEETLLVAEIDLAAARNKRIERTPGSHVIDRFADRRPEFYGKLSEPQ
ncbi:carbon-nitrogen hydrolase family protein [Candidatus Laterigemmans baculatus]|uniref:carbon-nitrogen hydrolase family protein n=1 Tax=Candidatus Laterigemmans baculatus TaxID=2770505 RepID=UPI0013DA4C4B|nr:carbon-nitrogen hydrolase family protein [Candidatus Laterigemmans baculatus]